ncbi:VWA domain-containing protein, partial [Deinococcus sp.]|uniref:vWA domain-containing protein n=1 Tax=Deinococcus sp. TaxID=47478 RepID=UPI002869870C
MLGQAFAAQVVVAARGGGVARLSLRRGGMELLDVPVTLRAGLNRLTLPLREDMPGTAGYTLTLTAPGGKATGGATVRAVAATRVVAGAVLVVSPDAAARRRLARALEVQGLASRELRPEQLTAGTLAGARRVTLLDTPARALTPEVRTALEDMVRSGGHLLIAGGRQAFGPGGYVGTALETLSPLSGRVQRDLPRLALGLALDKSGSMNEPAGGGVTRLDLVKSAALNSALLLSPESDVAVIAFDSAPKLAVPLTRASHWEQIRAQIGRIEAEGGTVVNRALVTTLKELMKSSASRKHMILLTDGIDGGIFTSEEYRRLIRRIRATGITVSTVSVGGGMHTPLMRDMARWGEGRFVQAQDWRDVPSLMARDTLEQGKSAVKTGTYVARWPVGPGFTWRQFTLGRYIRTTLKPGATPLGQVGTGADADPLGASWRVGLGSVSALAIEPTDIGNSLTRRADVPALVTPLVRGSGLAETPERRAPALTRDGADLVITAPDGQLILAGPQGDRPLLLQPDGQGGYLTRLYAPSPGGYSVDGAALGLPLVTGMATGGQQLQAPEDAGRPR